jgi:hypothetical protein
MNIFYCEACAKVLTLPKSTPHSNKEGLSYCIHCTKWESSGVLVPSDSKTEADADYIEVKDISTVKVGELIKYTNKQSGCSGRGGYLVSHGDGWVSLTASIEAKVPCLIVCTKDNTLFVKKTESQTEFEIPVGYVEVKDKDMRTVGLGNHVKYDNPSAGQRGKGFLYGFTDTYIVLSAEVDPKSTTWTVEKAGTRFFVEKQHAPLTEKPAENSAPAPEGYVKATVPGITTGTFVKYKTQNMIHFASGVLRAIYGKDSAVFDSEDGTQSWTVQIEGTSFFVKEQPVESETDTEVPHGYVKATIPGISIGTFVKYKGKGMIRFASGVLHTIRKDFVLFTNKDGNQGWPVQIEGTRFFVKAPVEDKSAELRDENAAYKTKIAELEAKLVTMLAEKDAVDAQLKISRESNTKLRKLSQIKNKGLPQEVLNIVDEYGLFDLVSLFRAIYKHDVDHVHLNSFAALLNTTWREFTTPVTHTIDISTTSKIKNQTTHLYHETRLADIHNSMKGYFAQNEVSTFSIDSTKPIVITTTY